MKLLLWIIAICLCIFLVLPIAWSLYLSFLDDVSIFGGSVAMPSFTLKNYRSIVADSRFIRPLFNSFVVSAMATVIAMTAAICAAFTLRSVEAWIRRSFLLFLILTSMFPQMLLLEPIFFLLKRIHLINTYPGLILPYISLSLPTAVWFAYSFLQAIPKELEEAAYIDGAGPARILLKILLPVSAPGLLATAVIVFVGCWNEFSYALALTIGPEYQTVPVAIAALRGQYQIPWGQIISAALVSTLPTLCAVLYLQRYIVSGLTEGALKG